MAKWTAFLFSFLFFVGTGFSQDISPIVPQGGPRIVPSRPIPRLRKLVIPPPQFLCVGPLGDVKKWEFVGCKTFSVEELRIALIGDSKLSQPRHPHSERTDLLRIAPERLESGYYAAGFADATVRAEIAKNKDGDLVRFHINEGRRYKQGAVQIIAEFPKNKGKFFSEKKLRQFLTQEQCVQPGTLIMQQPGEEYAKRLTEYYMARLAGETIKPTWEVGQTLNYSSSVREKLKERIEQAFALQGFFHPKFSYDLEKKGTQMHLVVKVQDLGGRAITSQFEFLGNKINSDALLQKKLNLSPGQTFTSDLWWETLKKFIQSGRFASHSIRPLFWKAKPAADNGDQKIPVLIELIETPSLPPLSKPLRPEQQALVDCVNWIARTRLQEDNFELKVSLPLSLLAKLVNHGQKARLKEEEEKAFGISESIKKIGNQLVTSSGRIDLFAKYFTNDNAFDLMLDTPFSKLSLVLTQETMYLFNHDAKRYCALPRKNSETNGQQRWIAKLNLTIRTWKGQDRYGILPYDRNTQIGAGLVTESNDEDAKSDLNAGMNIQVLPGALLANFGTTDPNEGSSLGLKWSVSEESVVGSLKNENAAFTIEVMRKTGRLAELSLESFSEKSHIKIRTTSPNQNEVSSPTGSLAKRTQGMQQTKPSPEGEFFTLCETLVASPRLQLLFAMLDKEEQQKLVTYGKFARWAIHKAVTLMNAMDDEAGKTETLLTKTEREKFSIPPFFPKSLPPPKSLPLVLPPFAVPELFAHDCWAQRVLLDVALFLQGYTAYFDGDLLEFQNNKKYGPLCLLAIANFCAQIDELNLATTFASVAEKRLTAEQFASDGAALFDPDSAVGKALCKQLLPLLRDNTAEEHKILRDILPEKIQKPFDVLCNTLRKNKGKPDDKAVFEALRAIWSHGAEKELRRELQRLQNEEMNLL